MSIYNIYANRQKLFSDWKVFLGKQNSSQAKSYEDFNKKIGILVNFNEKT